MQPASPTAAPASLLLAFVLGGLCAALVGIVFGLPSLRIRGFYLAAATLATQFFVVWCLTKIQWFTSWMTIRSFRKLSTV